jgi:hypothetical protein
MFLPKRVKALGKDSPRFRGKSLGKNTVELSDAVLDRVFASMEETENDLPLLYAHGKDPARGKMAAGWIRSKTRTPDGIQVEVELTKQALAEVKDRGWGYVSPGMDADRFPDGTVEPTTGFELSLTNVPVIDGQQRIAADRDGGDTMDMKKFAKLAGVADDSSEDAILEALGKKLSPEKPAGTGELGISDKQLEVLAERVGAAIGLDKLAKNLGEQAEKLVAADRKKTRVDALLERAMSEGKIVAAERKVTVDGKELDPVRLECENNPDAFEARLKVMPRKAPVGGAFPKSDKGDALTAGETTPGAFAEADLSNPDTRLLLHRAAKARVEAKQDSDYSSATLTLTRAN